MKWSWCSRSSTSPAYRHGSSVENRPERTAASASASAGTASTSARDAKPIRRALAGEDLDPRHPGPVRVGAHREVEGDRLQDVEELALVLVDALDVDVEHGGRVDHQPEPVDEDAGEPRLVAPLDGRVAVAEG